MKEKTFTVRIFDGTNTIIYSVKAEDAQRAEAKITRYHLALGGEIKKVTTTQRG
jgi:hypothetical protein